MKKDNLIAILQKQAQKDLEFVRLCRWVNAPKIDKVNLVGGFSSFQLFLFCLVAQKTKRKMLLLVADEMVAKKNLELLEQWLPGQIGFLRRRPLTLSEALATNHDLERERLACLSEWQKGNIQIMLTTAAATLERMPLPSWLDQVARKLQLGEEVEPLDLIDELAYLGYERVRQVEEAGQFALRGDIIDIGIYGSEGVLGYRISFFDNVIDSLRTLDLETLRSVEPIDTLIVGPVRELVLNKNDSQEVAAKAMLDGHAYVNALKQHSLKHEQIDNISHHLKKDIEHLRQGAHFANADRWIAFFPHMQATLFDYAQAQDAVIVVQGLANYHRRIDAAYASHMRDIELLLEKGQITSQASEAIWSPSYIDLKNLKHSKIIAVSDLGEKTDFLADGELYSFQIQPQDRFAGREEALGEELSQQLAKGEMSCLFVPNEIEVQKWQEQVPAKAKGKLVCDVHNIAEGLHWKAASLSIFGQKDIYGNTIKERRRSKQKSTNVLTAKLLHDLRPGELIVHDSHGIGRYEGLINMDINNVSRDYIKLSYAGGDTLFIPMEALSSIQKYVQVDSGTTKLSKLGGTDWNKAKQKARESVKQLAYDLLEVFANRERHDAHRYHIESSLQRTFEEGFAFEDTPSQERVWGEIKEDMASPKIMERLLCGDVGFGKTEMAFRALVKCVDNGYQAAMLAPTTVLARQHYENLSARLADLPIKVRQLSRFVDAKAKKQTQKDLKAGIVDIVIGTHSLLAKSIGFKNLGLLVIDEEQRFGVDHKERYKTLAPNVDVLTLTATPIPRTLHFSVAQIRDISVLEHGPTNRRSVQTYVMEYDEQIILEAIIRELSRDGQVFYLFNNTHRIQEIAMRLGEALPNARIGIAHGQMGERQLEQTISAFVEHQFDILVCTTIIESGLDMPNVNTIIVENADRLGLAQLYQIRGRVGRSPRQAYAYITYRREKALSEEAVARLTAIRDFTELGSGIKIARRDLEVRGAGDLLGAEQSGHLDTVGYEMYCRMLGEAVQEAKGEIVAPKLQASVELPVSAFISNEYIGDEGERMDMYRRLGAIDSYISYIDALDEMVDRYGETPAEAEALADIAFIRSAAEQTGIAVVALEQNDIVFRLSTHFPANMERVTAIMNWPKNRNYLVFNASAKPIIRWINGAKAVNYCRELVNLFTFVEQVNQA